MECTRCHAVNPDGKKYCGDCGFLLDPTLIPVIDLLRADIREQIQVTLREQLKDQQVCRGRNY
jgi:hypothetical protein